MACQQSSIAVSFCFVFFPKGGRKVAREVYVHRKARCSAVKRLLTIEHGRGEDGLAFDDHAGITF